MKVVDAYIENHNYFEINVTKLFEVINAWECHGSYIVIPLLFSITRMN